MRALISTIIGGLGTATCIFLHKNLVERMVDANLSWTFAFLMPYLLTVVFIVFFAMGLSQLIKVKRVYKKLIFIGVLLALFGVGFAVHPIYQGDLSNNAEEIPLYSNDDLLPTGLSMVALPGCQFCYGQIPTLKKLRARNPNMNMAILFVLPDSLSMDDYQTQLGESIDVISTQTPQLISELVGGKYPTYVYLKPSDQKFYKWSMDGLGAVGLDFLEGLHK
jgi:hypothetical protein